MKVKNNTPEVQIPERPELPEDCKGTGMYPMFQALNLAAQELERVPNILSATKRTRRHGAYISMSVIPTLDQIGDGPVLVPTPPAALIDADSYEDLRARLIHEIDYMIEIAKSQGGKKASGPKRLEEANTSNDNSGR